MGIYRKTPTLEGYDPRGLPTRTVDYWRVEELCPAQARIHRVAHDAAGRAVEQWDPRLWALQMTDPRAPANVLTVYSLSGQVLRSDSVDAGTRLAFPGLGAQVLFDWDSRGTRRDITHDSLLRPVAVFEEGESQSRRCVERFMYGQPGMGDPLQNQLGQVIRHDDPAGSVLFHAFAISAQCLENSRHYTVELNTPDWPEPIDDRQRLLEPGEGAISHWRFGPLGQVLEQTDARGNRHGCELTLDGRLRARHLQLKDDPAAQTLISDIQYNAEGQVTQEVAGNGVRTTLTYRPEDGRLKERRAGKTGSELLQQLIYDYDPMGNVLSIEDKAIPVRYFANQRIDPISRFNYDSQYRLSDATGWEGGGPDAIRHSVPAAVINYRQAYRYDDGGNLLQLIHVGGQNPGHQLEAARYSNRCLSWRDSAPPTEAEIAAAFDARGNLLDPDQGRRLQWDLRNQLVSVTPVQRQSGLDDCESYHYDGAGLRVRKVHQWQTNARTIIAETRYLPGLELHAHAGRDERRQLITVKGALNTVRIVHWDSPPPSGINDRFSYDFTDHLGSISLRLDDAGLLLSLEVFYPFGGTALIDGDISYKNFGYLGKELDATGFYYFGFRYYSAGLQRWINPDPAEHVDGLNRYWAMRNNPVFYLDRDGLVTEPGQQAGRDSSPVSGRSGALPAMSVETRGKVIEGAQVLGKTLSYAKNPLVGALGSALETGARLVEIRDAQAQMSSRQGSHINPQLSRMPFSAGPAGLIGLRTDPVGAARFDNPWGNTLELPSSSLSPLALQMLQAGFGSAAPESTSMAVIAEDPLATANRRYKRGLPGLSAQQ